jgi:hypothetical protein
MPIATTAKSITGGVRNDEPPQPDRMRTSNGRGRVPDLMIEATTNSITNKLSMNTRRCRPRRRNASAATIAHASTTTSHPEPAILTPRIAVVSHGAREAAKPRRITASTRFASWSSGSNRSEAAPTTASTINRTSHRCPLKPRFLGSGGGSPLGRVIDDLRRRTVRQ